MASSSNEDNMSSKLGDTIDRMVGPTNATEMRSFHGTIDQLAPYDAVLSRKFDPIRYLPKVKNGVIKFTEEESEAFAKVKKSFNFTDNIGVL